MQTKRHIHVPGIGENILGRIEVYTANNVDTCALLGVLIASCLVPIDGQLHSDVD